MITVAVNSPATFGSGPLDVVTLTAEVPATTTYRDKQIFNLSGITLNGGTIPAIDDDGVQLVAYFGDTTGNGTYSSLDAQRVLRLAVGLDSGLATYLLADPLIIGDITGNNAISSLDATRILQEVVGLDRPEIPSIPGGVGSITMGADPYVHIPTTLTGTPDNIVTVPVMIDDAVGLESVDLKLTYDPSVLEVAAVRTGRVTSGGTLVTNPTPPTNATGAITVGLALTTPRPAGGGSLIDIDFHVKSTAIPGTTTGLNLTQVSLNEDGLVLTPAPTPGLDPTDGLIAIRSAGDTAPVAADDAYTTAEDTPLIVSAPGLLANDTDVDGDALMAFLVSGPGHGTLSLDTTGAFTYVPAANFNGSDSFTYKANDGSLDSNVATVNLTITPVNDAPVAQDDSYTTPEDIPLVIFAPGVLGNDIDVEGDTLMAVLVDGSANGTLNLNPNGSITYTPATNFNGSDSFTYKANDGQADSNVAIVNLTITPLNDAPVAANDSYTTAEDTPLIVPAATGVLANDTDVEGESLTALLVDSPMHGTLVLTPDGGFTYTPALDFNGADQFTCKANDGQADSNVAIVNLTISPVNDAPLAANDSYTMDEDATLNVAAAGLLVNDTDVEGDALSALLVTEPSSGNLTSNADGAFIYTPNANFNGTDSFTYNANDGLADSNVATVAIKVNPVNDVPVAVGDAYSVDEDQKLNIAAPGVLGNDTDSDGDPLTAVLISGPSHGDLTLGQDGSFTYAPTANFNGSDSFTYRANDGTADSSVATMTITVNPVNDAPVATGDTYTTPEDTPISMLAPGVLGNDTDVEGDSRSAILVSGPAHGALTLNADGSFTYTPALNFNGADAFTYKANDGQADSNVATGNLTITPVNDAPQGANNAVTTLEDTPYAFAAVDFGFSDPNDNPADSLLAVKITTLPAAGNLTDNGVAVTAGQFVSVTDINTGKLVFTPAANANGTGYTSFSFQAQDDGGTANGSIDLDPTPNTLTVDVISVNDAPVAANDGYTVDEDTTLTIPAPGLLGKDTDVEGDALTAILVSGPASGTLTFDGDGSFVYTPNANFNGTDGFTYKANDGSADSNVATVTLTVNPVNDVPVALNDSYTVNEDTTLTIFAPGLLANDSDVDGDRLAANLVSGPAHGTLILNSDGAFTYSPAGNFNGADSFTYKASDGTLDSNVATVAITVAAEQNLPPVAQADTYSMAEDTPLTVDAPSGVLANDSDPNGDPLQAVLVDSPVHGTLALTADGAFTYTPALNFNGADQFTYKANDGQADSNVAKVSLTINPVNDAPSASDGAYVVNEDTALNIPAPGVLGNDADVDGDALTASLVSVPIHGSLTLNPDGSFTYAPDANFNGADSFTYRAGDGVAQSNLATLEITVNSVNDEPVANPDTGVTPEDMPVTILAPTLLANDTDVDGDVLTLIGVGNAVHGTVALDNDENPVFTPALNFNGEARFDYTIADGHGGTAATTVVVTVTSVNDAPVAADDTFTTPEDTPLTVSAPGLLGNDTDVEGDALTALLVSGPASGNLTFNGDGSFIYTPNANFNGSDSFTYKANDNQADSNVAIVALTITPVNDAPVSQNDAFTTAEDTPLIVPAATGVLANDTDVENDPLTAVLVDGPMHGTLSLSPNGSFTYTPAANFNGADSFIYKANDGTADSNLATVALTIAAVNDAPVPANDAYTTNEDTPLVVSAPGVLVNDSDLDGDSMTAALVAAPAHGTLILNSDGSFTYTPAANFNGSDGFTYKANDGTSDSSVATATITVNPVNDAPVAANDIFTTPEDTPLTISAPGILANDTDVEGDALTAVLVDPPTHGTLMLTPDGSFTYTPALNFNGADSFTYKANDGQADSNVATVNLTISPVNDAPVAADDAYTTSEDNPLTVPAPGLLGNDTDVENDPLTAVLVDSPTYGTLTLNADGAFTYTPALNFNGADQFTYKANDGQADSNVAIVNLTISPVNDAPLAANDSYTMDEDATLNVAAAGLLVNDTDVEGDPLSALVVTEPSSGNLTSNADGAFIYTPNANFNGTDSFTYKANDGLADSNVATVTITVNPINDAPVATNDSYIVDEDKILTVAVPGILGNDSDVDSNLITAVLVDSPIHGTLALNSDGSFAYTPAENFNGADSFTYKANDGEAESNVATVGLTITPVNDAPVAVDDTASGLQDTPVVIPVLANDTDVDGDTLSIASFIQPTHGAVADNGNGTLTYMPNANFTGQDSFTYAASDGVAQSNTATVSINVIPTNQAPVAMNDTYTMDEDTILTISVPGVLTNDSDVNRDPLTASLVNGPAYGNLTLSSDGSFVYASAPNFNGTDIFTYKANDGLADSNVATVAITVNSVNDAPVALDDSYATAEDTPLTIVVRGVLGNDTDVDGDTLTAALVSGPAHGTLSLNADGAFTYAPTADYNGADDFTYKANDAQADSNVATVTLTITPVNDAPAAANDAYTTNEDTALIVTAGTGVLANDMDVENDSLTAVLVDSPTHGTVSLNADGAFTYTPALNFNGADSFTYKANDGQADSNVATVSLTITPVNDAPIAVDDAASTLQDTPVVITVLANDTDVEGDSLSIDSFTQPAHGAVDDNGNGTLTYTPVSSFIGQDDFVYTISDGHGGYSAAEVTVAVTPVGEVIIDAGSDANNGTPDTFCIVRSGASIEVLVNDRVTFSTPYATAPLLRFDGSSDNDTLIVDFSGGNPIPGKGISYDGSGIGDNDSLVMTGGSASKVTHTFNGMGSGMAEVDGSVISYTSIIGITDSLYAADCTFLFGDAADSITIGDDGMANNNMSRISSVSSSVTVNFRNPAGSLTVNAGAGNDRITVGSLDRATGIDFYVIINGGAGDDYVDASRADFNVTLIGGTGNDTLLGGRRNDVVRGGDGNDFIAGGSGDDILYGDAGNDILIGGDGNDLILGGDGNDILSGDNGDDILLGGNGNDLLMGGNGNDVLRGEAGNDILFGWSRRRSSGWWPGE